MLEVNKCYWYKGKMMNVLYIDKYAITIECCAYDINKFVYVYSTTVPTSFISEEYCVEIDSSTVSKIKKILKLNYLACSHGVSSDGVIYEDSFKVMENFICVSEGFEKIEHLELLKNIKQTFETINEILRIRGMYGRSCSWQLLPSRKYTFIHRKYRRSLCNML